jgi:hypothetical protein
MRNLSELAKEIHANNVAKGWYENPRHDEESIMLCITELAEATEEVRNASPEVYVVDQFKEKHNVLFSEGRWHTTGGLDVALYNLKPEGNCVEIVDNVIRLLDLSEWKEWDLSEGLTTSHDRIEEYKSYSPVRFHFSLVKSLVLLDNPEYRPSEVVAFILAKSCDFIKSRGYDMFQLIDMKMSYNKNRSYKHNGKVL